MARALLDDGMSPYRLAQLRSLVSGLVLLVFLVVCRRPALRVPRSELPSLAFLGIAGLALVHASYFVAIDHLQVGAALTIQYLGPVLILVWLRVVHGRRLRRGLWGAAGLSVVGCFFVVRGYDVNALNALGVAAAFAAALSFAIYLVGSERIGHRHEPATTLVYAFGFASLFWCFATPLWSFPVHDISSAKHLALGLGVAIVGTLIPFVLMVTAVRHVPASRAGVVATLEPVLGALIAWPVLGERLAPPQVAGGLLVVAAVVWIQLVRPSVEAESAVEQASTSQPDRPAVEVAGR
jgi:drug/metabolite transporter (DMT)-like permease